MSAQISIKINGDVAIVKIVGPLSLNELLDANKALTKDGKFICNRRFWDLSECSIDFSSFELEIIAEFGDRAEKETAKVALLATRDLTYGLSRMFQAFRKSEQTTVSVFRDKDKAMHWLLSD